MPKNYAEDIKTLNKAFEKLSNEDKLTPQQEQQIGQINKEKDLFKKHQALSKFYIDNKLPSVEEVLGGAKETKTLSAQEINVMKPDQIKHWLQIYNAVLNTKAKNKELDTKTWNEYIKGNRVIGNDQRRLLLKAVEFYNTQINGSIADDYDLLNKGKQSVSTDEGATPIEILTNKGYPEVKNLGPAQVKVIMSYINYLEKIAGKTIKFT